MQKTTFKNRDFQLLLIILLLVIVFLIIQYLFLSNKWVNFVVGAISPLIFLFFYRPVKYTIEGDKLVLVYIFNRKKVIHIADILEIDLKKTKCLAFSYQPKGIQSASHLQLKINEIEMRVMQEELIRINPEIEILYD